MTGEAIPVQHEEGYAPLQHPWHVNNLANRRFGRLVVKACLGRKANQTWWACQCDCGSQVRACSGDLVTKTTGSCGCLNRDLSKQRATTHGKTDTSEHNIWCSMKRRCYKVNSPAYKWYGARGIVICDRWRNSFQAFLDDMGEKPSGMSIDRIDNDGSYTCGKCEECHEQNWPANCRWATRQQQSDNSRQQTRLTHDGKTLTLKEWAKLKGIPRRVLITRRCRGWTVARTLDTPKRKYPRRRYSRAAA